MLEQADGSPLALSVLERLIERIMAGLQWDILPIYIDNITVYGETEDKTTERLRVAVQRLNEAWLKLKPKKCHLYKRDATLFHRKGYTRNPRK